MRKQTNHNKNNKIIQISVISSIVAGIVIILIGLAYYQYRISELNIMDQVNVTEYNYHFAIISDNADEPFWDAVYQGAKDAGKEQSIYIEKIGSNLSNNYSVYDLMKIAIASKVDGIIIEPNEEKGITDLINDADTAGIPVVTLIKDLALSKRKSFIGINSYNQGQVYSRQVRNLVNAGKRNITILLNNNQMDSSQSVIYSSIIEEVKNNSALVKAKSINTRSTFSSEEDIRNIIMDTKEPTDVLVCLTALDTLSAYQTIVDYNKVGTIDIIGYYASELILQGIAKNIIYSTMTINAEQMGTYCVEALAEYLKTGRVSDFYSVNINVVNADNVEDYLIDNKRE